MFREMRRKDRKIETAEAEEILEKGEYGILSVAETEGYPYAVPVNYVYQNDVIYFHCAGGAGKKVDALKASSKVCFTVVGESEVLPDKFAMKYESVVVLGDAEEAGPEEKTEALKGFLEKYSSDFIPGGMEYMAKAADKAAVYRISISHMSGKARK